MKRRDDKPVVVPVIDIEEALFFYTGGLDFVLFEQSDWPVRVVVRPLASSGQSIELVVVNAWHFRPDTIRVKADYTEAVLDPFGNRLLFGASDSDSPSQ
jgi:hypothetical protein